MALGTSASASSLASLGVTAKDVPAVRKRVAELEARLLDARPAVGSAADRAKLARKQKQIRSALVELTAADSALALVHQDYDAAVDSARACLRHSVELHGEGQVELVPAYSLLAAAHLGVGKAHEAEELLATANWAVVRAGEAAPPVERSRVARGFGRLNASRGDLDRAAQSFAEAVYEVSLAAGPESVDAAHVIFDLGRTFDAMADAEGGAEGGDGDGSVPRALACYDKAVSSWYRALQAARDEQGGRPDPHLVPWAVLCEGSAVVRAAAAACARRLGPSHTAVHEATFTLALLEWCRGEMGEAEGLCARAVAGFEEVHGAEHATTDDARAALERVREDAALTA